jgi:hypothetical protein
MPDWKEIVPLFAVILSADSVTAETSSWTLSLRRIRLDVELRRLRVGADAQLIVGDDLVRPRGGVHKSQRSVGRHLIYREEFF